MDKKEEFIELEGGEMINVRENDKNNTKKKEAEYEKWKGVVKRYPEQYPNHGPSDRKVIPEWILNRLIEEEVIEPNNFNREENKKPQEIFTIRGQAENFYENNPFFYDKSGMFWIWNLKEFKYEMSDETDILNGISEVGVNTISSKTKTEILNALKQVGRTKIPKESHKTWIQFKEKIIDFKTGEEFKANPEYFITNPIPQSVGDTEETPTIDKLFMEWVGMEYVPTLYEIIAYSCSSNQFLQRLIALVGGGSNGKGTFMKLLSKFLGKDNVITSEIKELSSSGFETSAIYRKLLVVMGEISQGDLTNTNQLKKLSGEDIIRYCFKGKTPFSEESISTIISLTNSLPRTPDKTLGFYRKWLIVDFPNQFPIKDGIISDIPKEEFNNLAKKVIRILRELYKSQKFTNEGTYEERQVKYEERSNPVIRFIEEHCEEDYESSVLLKDFVKRFNEYSKSKHLRTQNTKEVKKVLLEEGFEVRKGTINYVKGVFIYNLKMNNLVFTPFTPFTSNISTHITHGKRIEENDVFDVKGVKEEKKGEIPQKLPELPKYEDIEFPTIREIMDKRGVDFPEANKIVKEMKEILKKDLQNE